jgi:hypothetical protein
MTFGLLIIIYYFIFLPDTFVLHLGRTVVKSKIELIACPSGSTIQTVSMKKTKHLELSDTSGT